MPRTYVNHKIALISIYKVYYNILIRRSYSNMSKKRYKMPIIGDRSHENNRLKEKAKTKTKKKKKATVKL